MDAQTFTNFDQTSRLKRLGFIGDQYVPETTLGSNYVLVFSLGLLWAMVHHLSNVYDFDTTMGPEELIENLVQIIELETT